MSEKNTFVKVNVFENLESDFPIEIIRGNMLFDNEKAWEEFEKLINLDKAETLSNGKKKFGLIAVTFSG